MVRWVNRLEMVIILLQVEYQELGVAAGLRNTIVYHRQVDVEHENGYKTEP